jgi:hypothetical protein
VEGKVLKISDSVHKCKYVKRKGTYLKILFHEDPVKPIIFTGKDKMWDVGLGGRKHKNRRKSRTYGKENLGI